MGKTDSVPMKIKVRGHKIETRQVLNEMTMKPQNAMKKLKSNNTCPVMQFRQITFELLYNLLGCHPQMVSRLEGGGVEGLNY